MSITASAVSEQVVPFHCRISVPLEALVMLVPPAAQALRSEAATAAKNQLPRAVDPASGPLHRRLGRHRQRPRAGPDGGEPMTGGQQPASYEIGVRGHPGPTVLPLPCPVSSQDVTYWALGRGAAAAKIGWANALRARTPKQPRFPFQLVFHGVSGCAGAGEARMIDVMARKVSVVTTDDLDGAPDAGTVSFGLDGVSYEIDLAPANRTRLAAAVAPYIAAGRKVSSGRRRRAPQPGAGGRVDRSAVRAWAREAGLAVSERGRISAEVMSQYEAAH